MFYTFQTDISLHLTFSWWFNPDNNLHNMELFLKLKSRYDWRSVSQYVLVSSPLWDLRPDINSVWNLLSCLSDKRSGQSLSAVIVHCQIFLSFPFPPTPFYMSHVLCIYNICKAQSTQAQYSRSFSIICSLHYNNSLSTWKVIRLTAPKYKHLKFSVSGFALLYIADISITMILYDFCLLPA
jgi:hypothetical protein